MPLPGKLKLKGGAFLGPEKALKKKKSKKKSKADAEDVTDANEDGTTPSKVPSQRYEEEFHFETQRVKEGKARSTPWGPTYRAPPAILHGYNKKTAGDTTEERLDYRCAAKADRMCK